MCIPGSIGLQIDPALLEPHLKLLRQAGEQAAMGDIHPALLAAHQPPTSERGPIQGACPQIRRDRQEKSGKIKLLLFDQRLHFHWLSFQFEQLEGLGQFAQGIGRGPGRTVMPLHVDPVLGHFLRHVFRPRASPVSIRPGSACFRSSSAVWPDRKANSHTNPSNEPSAGSKKTLSPINIISKVFGTLTPSRLRCPCWGLGAGSLGCIGDGVLDLDGWFPGKGRTGGKRTENQGPGR